jgi:hypothetical protein
MVFEMTVDTIFISFCIDLEENDGEIKPFYMSEGLKKVIMEMKEHSGGTLTFGPKVGPGGLTDGSGIPMIPMQQQQPVYPNIGYGDPNVQQPYPQQPYPPQPYQTQPMMPAQPMIPPQDYPDQKC